MFNWVKRKFSRKIEEPILSAEQKFFDAVSVFNEAWNDYNNQISKHRLRPWIEWSDREVILASNTFYKADRDDYEK